jgi:hypothetical protein
MVRASRRGQVSDDETRCAEKVMPSANEILTGLAETVNHWRWLSVIWHFVLFALVLAFLAGWRPSTRLIEWIAILPLLSVSALSWASNNPFNGIIFAALAVALAGATTQMPGGAVQFERSWPAVAGAALLVFGWTYPHFVSTRSWTEYAYAAPFGLIPCPTLSVVIGFTLIIRNLSTANWSLPLIAAGALYGLVGVFALRVPLDVGLLSGALLLAAVAARSAAGRSVRATEREQTRGLPGDPFIVDAAMMATHAITIHASPRNVWPWLTQMGAGTRAGWYSYDFVDNGRTPSASEIVPDLQDITVGTVFPAMPGVTGGFRVLAFEPNKSLVLGWLGSTGTPTVTWAFVLQSATDESTRLLVRARAGETYRFRRLPTRLSQPLMRPVHFLMQRKQLLGIKRRAERSVATPGVTPATPTRERQAS